jgi:chromosomal replication initiator protein
MDNFFNKLKSAIKQKIADHKFIIWIEPLSFIKYEKEKIYISCHNAFTKNKIETEYEKLIEEEAAKIKKEPVELFLSIVKRNRQYKKNSYDFQEDFQKPLPVNNKKFFSGRFLRDDLTFDNFIVGKSNELAYSAALSLASKNNGSNNTALFILSKTGLGKTHLSQAVGHHILLGKKKERVFYITAEDFMQDMVFAFKNNSLDKFKNKYRKNCDVLLIEDVHFISGKKRSQDELVSVLDMLFDAGKKVIFTSHYLPYEIPKVSENLQSRLSYALVSDILAPDYKTRAKILKNKAKTNKINIPDDVIDYMAAELKENIRQLESGLLGVNAKASLMGLPVDIALAASVIRHIITKQKEITLDFIKKIVAKHYGITISDIVSKSRKKAIVRPRQVAMYLARKYTDQPLFSIGKGFNRIHATVLHSINSIESVKKNDNALSAQIKFFCDKFDNADF